MSRRRTAVLDDDDDDDLVMSDIKEVKDAQRAGQGEDEDMEMLDAAAAEEGASVKTPGKELASDPGRDRGEDGKMFMVAVEIPKQTPFTKSVVVPPKTKQLSMMNFFKTPGTPAGGSKIFTATGASGSGRKGRAAPRGTGASTTSKHFSTSTAASKATSRTSSSAPRGRKRSGSESDSADEDYAPPASDDDVVSDHELPSDAAASDVSEPDLEALELGSDEEELDDAPKPKYKSKPKKAAAKPAKQTTLPNSLLLPNAAQHKTADNLPPIHDIGLMFEDIVKSLPQVQDLAEHLGKRKLRVATMCSGTESPLLALGLISRAIKKIYGKNFDVEHVFSCEIEPFKQAYIERNFQPPLLFRDVCELGDDEATTAYGAKVPVPGNVDVLIAGTSCVDYSNLNNKKLDLDAGGESGRTFAGMLDWVTKTRPPVVILENVCNGPWPRMAEKFQAKGYSAHFERLDTKHYYIPHTRQRGYMMCLDVKASNIPRMWGSAMKDLARPANCSLESFLLPGDDPRIHQARQNLIKSDRSAATKGRTVDWTRCETRHQKMRLEERLGNKRPLTFWQEAGLCKLPDFAWGDWGLAQVERVLDLMDILFIKAAKAGIDTSFKTQVWNLSQNVDRNSSTGKPGICPCLTPTMIPYLTNRGGPMVGLEALSMQGLPINELLLTKETEDQLADLAGNAMSTTVVGTAILSALVLAKKHLEQGEAVEMDVDETVEDISYRVSGDEQLVESALDLFTTENVPLKEILDGAQRSRRLCQCEGREQMTSNKLNICLDCGFPSCEKCGGRPEHNYVPYAGIDSRIVPSAFAKLLKRALPMRLKLGGIDGGGLEELRKRVSIQVNDKHWAIWKTGVTNALAGELRFRSLKRQEMWSATYEAPSARLELHLDPKQPEWRLYAKPDETDPANAPSRKLLAQYFARMRVGKDAKNAKGLVDGNWEISLPGTNAFDVDIKGEGELVPSWEAQLGLQEPQWADKKVWSKLKITVDEDDRKKLDRDISGTYTLFDKCGTASAALHKKDGEEGEDIAPLFFFLDPTRCGGPKDDPFVFSSYTKRYAIGEERPLVAKLDTAWRQSSSSQGKKVKCFVEGEWRPISSAKLVSPTLETVKDHEATFAMPELPLKVEASNDSCRTAQAVLVVKVPLEGQAEKVWPEGYWGEVDKIHERGTYECLAWLTERIKSLDQLSRWNDLALPEDHSNCERCAPSDPELKWVLVGKKVVPIEDAKQAGPYETALKNRPSPFITQLRLDEATGMGHLRIGLNIASLVHRALSRLPHENRDEKPILSWRMTTDYTPPLKLVLPRFKLTSNKKDKSAKQPPNFVIPLRPEQLRSLTWMLAQESDEAPPFIEEEIAEAELRHLGWKAEGKAERPLYVKGGVLADEVGYGKTAITLGLIDASRNRVSKIQSPNVGCIPVKATLIVVPPHLTNQWPSEITKFTGSKYRVIRIQSQLHLNQLSVNDIMRADIIVVACGLFKSDKYLANLAGFAGASSPPSGDGRRFNAWLKVALGKLRGHVDELKDNGAEAVTELIDSARQRMKEEAEEAFIQGKRLKGAAYREAQESAQSIGVKAAPGAAGKKKKPSPKRKREESDDDESMEAEFIEESSDGVVVKKGKKAGGAGASKASTRGVEAGDPWKLRSGTVKRDWKNMQAPPLDIFHFNRLVVDEYTYLKGQIHSGITSLRSTYKWVLSGTPPLDDFADVKTISVFLGIHLGIDDGAAVKRENMKKIEKEKTAVEKFNSFREVRSPAWHERRHAVAQIFLNQFVRQNIAEIDEIPFEEHIVPIHLPAAERAIYLELEHHLQALDMNIKKGKVKSGNDREKRLQESLGESASAEEALLKRSSHFDLDITEKDQENALRACEVIVRDRTKGLASLMDELRGKLKAQFDLQNSIGGLTAADETFFGTYVRVTREKGVGDGDASRHMKGLIDVARGKTGATEVLKKSLEESGVTVNKYFWFNKDSSTSTTSKSKGKSSAKKPKPKKRRKARGDDSDEGDSDDLDDDASPTSDFPDEPLIPKTRDEKLQLLRDNTHNVKRLQKEMVGRVRSLRYFKLVRDLQQSILTHTQTHVSCPGCSRTNLPASDIAVLSSCGHMGCYDCLISSAQKEECISPGCEAAARILNVVKGDSLGVEDERDGVGRRWGIKLEKVVKLIKEELPVEEKVLVFVQFPDLMQKVSEALDAHDVRHLQIKGTANSKSKALEAFQQSPATGPKSERVLLLNVMDESASGANLTNSNHAIFLSPLLTSSQYEYNACETQAIGRVRRYGQMKTVHIWRFLTMNSIDVEIWEERSARKVTGLEGYKI
ncbi:hypothetical protein BGX38DRAFT_1271075 [Terfezia claveryi]|nr:hypothetical protein BGX38DRAFT_1271075 [Terfezia claveryi]